MRAQEDPSRNVIKKHRRVFLYKDRYYQIDVYQEPHSGLVLLEAYLDYDDQDDDTSAQKNDHDLLPDWLDLIDVTNDKQYSMYTIARKQ